MRWTSTGLPPDPGPGIAPFGLSFYVDGAFAGQKAAGPLASNASALVTLSWCAAPGSHTLSVRADEEGSLPETSETNNAAQTSFGPLSLLYSDLSITSFTITPGTADPAFLIEEKSRGNNTAQASLTTTGSFSPDPPQGFTLSLTADREAYAYWETVMLTGDARDASGALSSALVAVSFGAGAASITRYASTDEGGHWTLAVPALELIESLYLEAGATGAIGQIEISASATSNGAAAGSQATISITGPDPASPILSLLPDSLLFGLRPGEFRMVELSIANIGNASLKLSAIRGMALLPWMSLAVPAKLDLAPGEKITVNLYLAPPSDMVLAHAFSGNLKVEGTYGTEGEERAVARVRIFINLDT